jgi:hypothetical protein
VFSFRCDRKQNLRDVKIHGLFTLLTGLGLHKPRSAALDLNLAASFLLNVFDVVTSATDNLCSQVEATDRFQAYGKLLFGPFALELGLAKCFSRALQVRNTYTTKFIAFKVLRFTATEATLIYQIGQLLCQHLFDHLDSLVESFLRSASNAEIKGRVLAVISDTPGGR